MTLMRMSSLVSGTKLYAGNFASRFLQKSATCFFSDLANSRLFKMTPPRPREVAQTDPSVQKLRSVEAVF
jgi:hypothetical protein